jgi:hypothetical protein
MGAAGELAARRYLGLDETLGTHFDGGVDLTLHGLTVDIKSTRPWSKWLQIAYYKRVVADVVLMMSINLKYQTAQPFGFAWREEVLNAPLDLRMDDACHHIPVEELHSVQELLNVCCP